MQKIDDKTLKNRWMILLTIVSMTFMACLDSSIVNVALPVMSAKLNTSMASIEWVVTSYLIVISSTILIFGRLGDIKGKTSVFRFGVLLFSAGSLLCGIAYNLPLLVGARMVQAIGAACTMSTSQGIITQVFPANERGRALGLSGTFVALGTMVGPPLGGFIVSILSWQYIFLINVPIGILAFVFGMKMLPKDAGASGEKLDGTGALLFVIAIVSLFGSLIQGQESGYDRPYITAGFVIAVIALVLFFTIERRMETPLLNLQIFKNRLFSISILCGFITFVAISCSNIIQPFYLQYVLKLSPAVTGLFMMVYPLILSVVAPISGHLSDKIGSEFLTFLGLMFTSAGLLMMSTLNEMTPLWTMVIFIGIMSLGNGLFQSPNTSLIMSTVPKNKLGIAGSVNALIRNLGMIVGISYSTTLLYNRMSYKIGYRVSNFIEGRSDVFVYGMRYVYITAALICLTGAAITAFRLYGSRQKKRELQKNPS